MFAHANIRFVANICYTSMFVSSKYLVNGVILVLACSAGNLCSGVIPFASSTCSCLPHVLACAGLVIATNYAFLNYLICAIASVFFPLHVRCPPFLLQLMTLASSPKYSAEHVKPSPRFSHNPHIPIFSSTICSCILLVPCLTSAVRDCFKLLSSMCLFNSS